MPSDPLLPSEPGDHDRPWASVGRIAHDLNNLMAALQGYTEMLLEDVQPASQMQADLQQMHQAALRASRLVGELLQLSR